MLDHLKSETFNKKYLDYVFQDPVHSFTGSRTLARRCQFDRNIFFKIENDKPVAVLCVAFTDNLPDDISNVLEDNSPLSNFPTHAIFYSVFRTDEPTKIKNVGAQLIREAASYIRDTMPDIKNFVTMSPIPNLSAHFKEPPTIDSVVEFLKAQGDPVARFHVGNGARVLRVIPNADRSESRQNQSYGLMANYDYTQNILGLN